MKDRTKYYQLAGSIAYRIERITELHKEASKPLRDVKPIDVMDIQDIDCLLHQVTKLLAALNQ